MSSFENANVDQKPSLVLVTVDCLRSDHTGFGGYEAPTTPFLDSLAQESLVFPTAIVAGAPTYYSFPAIFAGRSALAFGRDVVGVGFNERTLATVLRDAGYATAAFTAGNAYLTPRFGYALGFDTFHDFLDADSLITRDSSEQQPQRLRTKLNRWLERTTKRFEPVAMLYDDLRFEYGQFLASRQQESMTLLRRYPAADVIVDRAKTWLKDSGSGPFFLWLHFMDPHAPYYPPNEPLLELSRGDLNASRARYLNSYWNRGLSPRRLARHRRDVVSLYDAGIRWVDDQVRRLTTELRKSMKWENTVFVFTADHGEEFLEHGGCYHSPVKLTEELIHVPLFMRIPGQPGKKMDRSPFGLVHLTPTLLDLMGIRVADAFQTRSFGPLCDLGQKRDEPVVVECVYECNNPFHRQNRLGSRILAVRDLRYKLVIDFRNNFQQLFDLEADPKEKAPLPAQTETTVRRRLLQVACDHLQRINGKNFLQARFEARLHDIRLEWDQTAASANHRLDSAG